MFYTSRVLFVHAPRTGGEWLTRWAKSRLGEVAYDGYFLKHATHPELVRAVPELADLQAFTIVRDEEARFASWLRLFQEWRPDAPPTFTPQCETIARDAHRLSEAEWRRWYFTPNAAYRTPGVRVFPYEPDLAACVSWLRSLH